MSKSPKQVLLEAADLCERGWCQNVYEKNINGVECFCILGSMLKVVGITPEQSNASLKE